MNVKHKVSYTVRAKNNVVTEKVEKFDNFIDAYKFGQLIGRNVGPNVGQTVGKPIVEKV